MKKFGKRICENEIFEDDENLNNFYYDNELSKKLKLSNSDNQTDNYDLLRNKYSSSSKKINVQKKENQFKNLEENKNCQRPKKLIRLSEMEDNNLYNILQIPENSDLELIKKSYKNLSKIHHPDKGGDSEKFQKINHAYRILSNAYCRKLYDTFSYNGLDMIESFLNDFNTNQESLCEMQNDQILDLEAMRVLIQMNSK